MRGKVVLLVLDGVGVGEAPDAAAFGDVGSNSVGNTARQLGELALPNLGAFGMGALTDIPGTPVPAKPLGSWGKIAAISAGKDSTTGHWEMCGLVTEKAFPTYPQGFPPEVLQPFEAAIGHHVLGNKAISGTVILDELGEQHFGSGDPIVYTSADSVFQIATHEEVIDLPTLYRWCEIAREQLVGKHHVGRVIARPFVGTPGHWQRTGGRRDYAVEPPGRSLLQVLESSGHQVIGVGKIEDLFSGQGLTDVDHTTSNAAGMAATLRWHREARQGAFIFVNLNDFDSLWGHRNDVAGYAQGLQEFDAWLPQLLGQLSDEDLLLITSDHGNDPTTPGTDHSREFVPILAVRGQSPQGGDLGVRRGLADIAATVLEHWQLPQTLGGRSFLGTLGAW